MIHFGSHFCYSMASANFSRLTGLYVWLIQINSHRMSHTANDSHSSGISRFVRSMQEILSEGPTHFLPPQINTEYSQCLCADQFTALYLQVCFHRPSIWQISLLDLTPSTSPW